MASAQRTPRDIPFEADAEYQRLVEQHRQYEAELQKISKSPYLNSEDLLEEIKLKKMKLHCKDEMERIAARIIRARASYSQYRFYRRRVCRRVIANNDFIAGDSVVE